MLWNGDFKGSAMQKLSPRFSPPGTAHKLLAQTGVGRVTQDYPNNRNVFAQGEVAGSVLFIQMGRVKLTVISNYGKEAVIGIMEAGQFFGEGCLQNQPLRRYSNNVKRLPHYLHYKRCNAFRDPRSAAILQTVHGSFIEPQ
jgi:CRP-like cAMP-binding protein